VQYSNVVKEVCTGLRFTRWYTCSLTACYYTQT